MDDRNDCAVWHLSLRFTDQDVSGKGEKIGLKGIMNKAKNVYPTHFINTYKLPLQNLEPQPSS